MPKPIYGVSYDDNHLVNCNKAANGTLRAYSSSENITEDETENVQPDQVIRVYKVDHTSKYFVIYQVGNTLKTEYFCFVKYICQNDILVLCNERLNQQFLSSSLLVGYCCLGSCQYGRWGFFTCRASFVSRNRCLIYIFDGCKQTHAYIRTNR